MNSLTAGYPPQLSQAEYYFANTQLKYDVQQFSREIATQKAVAGFDTPADGPFVVEIDYTEVPIQVKVLSLREFALVLRQYGIDQTETRNLRKDGDQAKMLRDPGTGLVAGLLPGTEQQDQRSRHVQMLVHRLDDMFSSDIAV